MSVVRDFSHKLEHESLCVVGRKPAAKEDCGSLMLGSFRKAMIRRGDFLPTSVDDIKESVVVLARRVRDVLNEVRVLQGHLSCNPTEDMFLKMRAVGRSEDITLTAFQSKQLEARWRKTGIAVAVNDTFIEGFAAAMIEEFGGDHSGSFRPDPIFAQSD